MIRNQRVLRLYWQRACRGLFLGVLRKMFQTSPPFRLCLSRQRLSLFVAVPARRVGHCSTMSENSILQSILNHANRTIAYNSYLMRPFSMKTSYYKPTWWIIPPPRTKGRSVWVYPITHLEFCGGADRRVVLSLIVFLRQLQSYRLTIKCSYLRLSPTISG